MQTLTYSQINHISGGADTWEDIGYAVGYAIGYFYNNVMIGNGVVDDLAETISEE